MRNEKAKKEKHAKYIFASIGTIAILVMSVNIFFSREKVDRASGCPQKIKKASVFILDRSMLLAEQTRTEILSRIEKIIRDKVSPGEKLTFLEINDDAYMELKPLKLVKDLDSFCKPKSEADNALTENPHLIRTRYKSQINEILKNEALKSKGGNSKSPITQVVFDAVLSQYVDAEERSLYIFSDLMENSKDVSLYNCSSGEQAVKTFRSSRSGRSERPILTKYGNVELHLMPISLSPEVLKCRTHFWKWFLGDLKFVDNRTVAFEDLLFPLPG